MAVINQKNKEKQQDRYIADQEGFVQSLKWPSGLSLRERISLYKYGKKDGYKQIAGEDKYHELTSPFCEMLIYSANCRIEQEWKECDESLFQIAKNYKIVKEKIKKFNQQIQEAHEHRDRALASLKQIHYDGDDVVSEHLANRRKQVRKNRVIEAYDNEVSSINEQIELLESERIPFILSFTQIEKNARSNERIFRAHFLWRLSVYAYGASNYIKITPDMINDNQLTSEPRKMHDKIFHDIKKDINLLDTLDESDNKKDDNDEQDDSNNA